MADPLIFSISRARKVKVRGSAEYYRMMVLTNRNFVVTINFRGISRMLSVHGHGDNWVADPPIFPISRARKVKVRGSAD